MNLRDYQTEAVEAVEAEFAAGKRSTLLVMPTGTGKTVCFGELIRRLPADRRAMVLAHREELIFQAADKIHRVTGEHPAIEMADRFSDEGLFQKSRIVVSTIQTQVTGRYAKFNPDEFGLVIADECFVAGTLVDGKPIEKISAGDFVWSFNHKAQRPERRRVVRVFRSRPSSVVRLTIGRKRIVCTPGHPFWTLGGYVPARLLERNQVMTSICHAHTPTPRNMQAMRSSICGDMQSRNLLKEMRNHMSLSPATADSISEMLWMRETGQDHFEGSCSTSQTRASGLLLNRVPGQRSFSEIIGCHGKHQSEIRIRSDEKAKPHATLVGSRENDRSHEGQNVFGTGRKRTANQTADRTGQCSWAADGASDSNEAGSRQVPVFAGLLQSGCGEPDAQTGYRGGRQDSQTETLEVSRQAENLSLECARVDRVEILERGGDERFGGLCPDGFVYNIEVEGNHNYFAEGVLVHNCHHSVADSWRTVIGHYQSSPGCRLLGVTATPDRTDEEALGQMFESCAFRYEIADAIRDGWLVPVSIRQVFVEGLSYDSARTTAGDLNQGDVARIQSDEATLHAIVSPVIGESKWRRTLVFCAPGYVKDTEPEIHIADRACEILNRHRPGCARRVHQGTPKDERRQTLADFAAGRFQYCVNVGVLTEGFDDPGIECVAVLRPTKSRSLYAQMLGRGTRPLAGIVDGLGADTERTEAIAGSKKPNLLIIDVVGNSQRHDLAGPLDVLGGEVSERVREQAEQLLDESDGEQGVDELLEEAERRVQEATENERKRRASVVGVARYRVHDVLQIDPVTESAMERGKPPSERMIEVLDKAGVEGASEMGYARAKQVIAEIIRRREKGLCTYKQARMLRKQGYNTADMPFERASQLIGELMGRWRARASA